MDEIELIKKYTGWQNVKKHLCLGFKFYFESPFGDLNELDDLEYFYSGGLDEYLIVIGKDIFYIGYWHDNKNAYCFAECDTLKEACESL